MFLILKRAMVSMLAIVFVILGCDRSEPAKQPVPVADEPETTSTTIVTTIFSEQGERIRKLIIEGKLTGSDDLLKSMMDDHPDKRPLQLLWVAATVNPMGDRLSAWGQTAKLGYDEETLGNHWDRLRSVCMETSETYLALVAESMLEIVARRVGPELGFMLSDDVLYRLPGASEFPRNPGQSLAIVELVHETDQNRKLLEPKFVTYRCAGDRDAAVITYGTMASVAVFHLVSNDESLRAAFLTDEATSSEFSATQGFINAFSQWGAGINVLHTAREFYISAGVKSGLPKPVHTMREKLLSASRYPSVLGLMLKYPPESRANVSCAMESLELILSHAISKGSDAALDRALLATSLSGQIHEGNVPSHPFVVKDKVYVWSEDAKSDSRFTRVSSLLTEAVKRRPEAAKALFVANP